MGNLNVHQAITTLGGIGGARVDTGVVIAFMGLLGYSRCRLVGAGVGGSRGSGGSKEGQEHVPLGPLW